MGEHFQAWGGKWNLTIYYGWGSNLVDNLYGQERLLAQGGGNVVRMTKSQVLFNPMPPDPEEDGAVRGFFADPTPWNNSAYTVYESTMQEFFTLDTQESVGEISVGRVLSGAKGLAVGRIDLFTIAMHEIGHSLGLDTEYVGHNTQVTGPSITITSPLPLAGAFIPLSNFGDHVSLNTALMTVKPHAGKRQLITGLDALVIAQCSSFARPYLGEPTDVFIAPVPDRQVDDGQVDGE